MSRTMFSRVLALGLIVVAGQAPAAAPQPFDLSRPFALPAGWKLIGSQGPGVEDAGGNPAPGPLHLCITRDDGKTCHPALDDILASPGEHGDFDVAHYLNMVRVVHPRAGRPLLWVEAASIHGGNGDQLVGRMALAFDRNSGGFVTVFRQTTGRNNNQDIRYVDQGPLNGTIISAVPTQDAPFGFWIVVNRMASDGRYAPVLRYRSGTRYGDGNTLAVIDSEMPEIQRRLNLWKPGQPLPLPDQPCPRPHLVKTVLWCAAPPARGKS
ncbi:hypothetical protein [Sphingomonas sp. Leaf21]|uniref:hypothetical protein n=1 Tax=Sphingomonas sp. Leaf21 TaxID=2876550 RepID=UPI001E2D7166|nr:hypothetical protein [Sphingomonas sp. Leaf21]